MTDDYSLDLIYRLAEKQLSIRKALCDNFNTPLAIQEMRNLIVQANSYNAEKQKIQANAEKQKTKGKANSAVLKKIAIYVTKLMRIYGVFEVTGEEIGSFAVASSSSQGTTSSDLMPLLQTMAAFRDQVRLLAQQKSNPVEILKVCDRLRDDDLIEHGVVLEDRDGAGALVKLVDKQLLIDQRAEKKAKEEQKAREKAERARQEEIKRQERLEKGKTKPEDLFKTEEYTEWDEKVIFFFDCINCLGIAGKRQGRSRGSQIKAQKVGKRMEHPSQTSQRVFRFFRIIMIIFQTY